MAPTSTTGAEVTSGSAQIKDGLTLTWEATSDTVMHFSLTLASTDDSARVVLLKAVFTRMYGAPPERVALAGGPLAAAGLALGWVLPGAPMHRLDGRYLDRQAERTDLWVGREHTAELDALEFVVANTAEDAVLYDMSQSRPMPILAAGRPWVWCSTTFDTCGTAMQQGEGSIADAA